MSPKIVRPIPADTASAGSTFFTKSTFYRSVGDQLDELCVNLDSDSTAHDSDPHIPIPFLFLITVFQYLESLSDAQATEAVISRVDWKYALHLPLISLGFDQKELDEYHRKLLADPTVLHHLNGLLEKVRSLYDIARKDPKKVDTTSMLNAVHTLNRRSQMMRAMRLALEELATHHPDWLKGTVLPHWFQRFARSSTEGKAPATADEREALALAVGEDGFFLLDALKKGDAPPGALQLPEVQYFRHVWKRQFVRTGGKVKWLPSPGP